MKTSIKLAAVTALAITSLGVATDFQPAPGERPEPLSPGPRHHPHRHGPPPHDILGRFDMNKDGTFDETERATLQQAVADGQIQPPPMPPGPRGPAAGPPPELVAQYDVNQDGQLDETEHAALRQDIEDGKLPPPPPRGPRGDRQPPSASDILERFDADKDGKLDATELGTFLSARRPPPRKG